MEGVPGETYECPFALPDDYKRALATRQAVVHDLKEQLAGETTASLSAAQQGELQDAVARHFHQYLQQSGNLRQVTDLIALSEGSSA